MTTVRMTIPDDFILGAAASAWQTEAGAGKNRGRTPGPISGTKTTATSGITAMAQRWLPILLTAFRKTCS